MADGEVTLSGLSTVSQSLNKNSLLLTTVMAEAIALKMVPGTDEVRVL